MTTEKFPALFHNRTMPPCTIIPELAYGDVAKAIEWLCETFGFTERWRVGNHRAQLAFGNGAVVLSERSGLQEPGETGSIVSPLRRHSLLVRVPDILLHYGHVSQRGAQILEPPADFPYGERQYAVIDIGGHRWTFSQSIADLAPEDWGGTTAGRGI